MTASSLPTLLAAVEDALRRGDANDALSTTTALCAACENQTVLAQDIPELMAQVTALRAVAEAQLKETSLARQALMRAARARHAYPNR